MNQVNVRSLALSLGITVDEVKSNEELDYVEWLHVAVHSGIKKFRRVARSMDRIIIHASCESTVALWNYCLRVCYS